MVLRGVCVWPWLRETLCCIMYVSLSCISSHYWKSGREHINNTGSIGDNVGVDIVIPINIFSYIFLFFLSLDECFSVIPVTYKQQTQGNISHIFSNVIFSTPEVNVNSFSSIILWGVTLLSTFLWSMHVTLISPQLLIYFSHLDVITEAAPRTVFILRWILEAGHPERRSCAKAVLSDDE